MAVPEAGIHHLVHGLRGRFLCTAELLPDLCPVARARLLEHRPFQAGNGRLHLVHLLDDGIDGLRAQRL